MSHCSNSTTEAEGSVLTSLSSSAVLGEQIYGPYGNQRYTQGTMGTDKGYTGQFQDAVSGLDYYNACYYDPVMGQFLSADSVQGNAQGMDPYSYVNGNPETATDPTGQRISCPPDCGGGGGTPCTLGDPGCNSPPITSCDPGFTPKNGGCEQTNPPNPPGSGGTNSGSGDKGCGNLSSSACAKGKTAQQKAVQDLKNQLQWIKMGSALFTLVADIVVFVKDLLTASGILRILELIGGFISIVGDLLSIASQLGMIFHWTGIQAVIDGFAAIANAIGAVYKGIRAALATPWGAVTAGLLVIGFYTARIALFGGTGPLVGTILGALSDHATSGKDNPWKFLALAGTSAFNAWANYQQYQIDLVSNESTATYCHNNPTSC